MKVHIKPGPGAALSKQLPRSYLLYSILHLCLSIQWCHCLWHHKTQLTTPSFMPFCWSWFTHSWSVMLAKFTRKCQGLSWNTGMCREGLDKHVVAYKRQCDCEKHPFFPTHGLATAGMLSQAITKMIFTSLAKEWAKQHRRGDSTSTACLTPPSSK